MKCKLSKYPLFYKGLSGKAATSGLLCLCLFSSAQILKADPGASETQTIQAVTQKSLAISGVVTDTKGTPLVGVNVVIKGTSVGTITDLNGKYSLQVPNQNSMLSVSYIGFQSKLIPIGKSRTINITLEDDSKALGEVVVVGYGTMRKKDLTGSVIQIRPEKLADSTPKTVQDILRGTPGLAVGLDVSAKGGGTLQIRGQRSVYTDGGHNDPLIILDGMMFYGELSEINPDDIGQIDILKDASAASVYGAKAANGVIIVTTKKGKQGKPVINLTSNIGIVTMGFDRPVYNAAGYLKYRRDWYTSATYGTNATTGNYEEYQSGPTNVVGKYGYYDEPTDANFAKYGITIDQWRAYSSNATGISDRQIWGSRLLLDSYNLANLANNQTFDWYNHSFRTGLNQDYNISASGATDRTNYYMSLGYMSNQGVVVGNNYTAIRSNLKVNSKITNWFELGANVNFQDRTDDDQAVDWATQITANSPFAQYKNAAGELEMYPMGTAAGNKGYNYDYNRQFQQKEGGYTVLNSIFNAKVTLPLGITYSFNASPRFQWYYYRYFQSAENPNVSQSSVNRNSSKRFDWSLNNTFAWDKTIAEKHHFVVTLVQEAEERKMWSDNLNAVNLQPSDALGFHNVGVADKTKSSFSSNDTHETADGKLARLFYSYDNRYMFTGSLRRDGYSAFGTSNPRATFYSGALAWSFANEGFFKWKPMSTGKLRVSWGQNGNRSLDNVYVALANLGGGSGATEGYIDASGTTQEFKYFIADRLANTHLKWEKTSSWNAGLDFGFLNDRITGSIDYYIMPTTDMIMNQSLPGFSGFSSITCNLGEVENRGFELSLNTQNIKTRNFEWNTTFGFSKYQNSIKHLYGTYTSVLDADGNVVGVQEDNDISNGWFIGKPISAIWNYRVTGIWQKNEATEAAKYGQRPGDPKVANNYTADDIVNANGTTTPVYNNKDKEFLGQTTPPINWSIRNDFTIYKNWDISFNIYSKMGHKSVETFYLNNDNAGSVITYGYNVYKKNYWTIDNPTNEYARLDAHGPSGLTSPAILRDRSFIRLENISVGYTVPKNITSKCNIEKLKIFANVTNVAVWAKDWKYGDPETGNSTQGYFSPRTYNIGLNATF
jgi:TonB-linked outer membrane protein, SusC/RagA family